MTSTLYSPTPSQLFALKKLHLKQEKAIIAKYPEIVPDILRYHLSPPLNSRTEITSFSYSIEGVTLICFQKGQKPYYLPCPPNYSGVYSECHINGDLVLLEFEGELIVDRLSSSVKTEIAQILNLNKNDAAN